MIYIKDVVKLLIMALFLINTSCSSSTNKNQTEKIHRSDSNIIALKETTHPRDPSFSVVFTEGCFAIRRSRIGVYFVRGRYYAAYFAPIYDNSIPTQVVWTIELNEKQRDACSRFLNKAKTLPAGCGRSSSSEYRHDITIGDKVYFVYGECDWDGLSFDYLDEQLFGDKHIAMDQRILGKWYLQNVEKGMEKDSVITFSNNKISAYYVEFLKNNIVSCKLPGISNTHSYETRIAEDTVLYINKPIPNLSNPKYDGDHYFRFQEISNNELKLIFFW
ncbi:hypothetical protein CJD36_010410 [Flavipsychrobacter stenotrophus]|uniref:DKNYY family protein n=1 Tax=Flavipsychrobacter stenotrophus TaxID=2077091 RepID=A0A2S7SUT5_9BACT|nr:hypothetical protein [Flavipsychrobacter stenotrophus]PQJ10381.1 hypothetical protein CJD36_010410 [Flavipsychrobacter stenotrophus]